MFIKKELNLIVLKKIFQSKSFLFLLILFLLTNCGKKTLSGKIVDQPEVKISNERNGLPRFTFDKTKDNAFITLENASSNVLICFENNLNLGICEEDPNLSTHWVKISEGLNSLNLDLPWVYHTQNKIWESTIELKKVEDEQLGQHRIRVYDQQKDYMTQTELRIDRPPKIKFLKNGKLISDFLESDNLSMEIQFTSEKLKMCISNQTSGKANSCIDENQLPSAKGKWEKLKSIKVGKNKVWRYENKIWLSDEANITKIIGKEGGYTLSLFDPESKLIHSKTINIISEISN